MHAKAEFKSCRGAREQIVLHLCKYVGMLRIYLATAVLEQTHAEANATGE